jgi:hypothetical protein
MMVVVGGIWGASRHALTVGFISVMVLSIGQRILPAFAGMRLLWSTKLMFAGLLLLSVPSPCGLKLTPDLHLVGSYCASFVAQRLDLGNGKVTVV